jgi:hypothetical protein
VSGALKHPIIAVTFHHGITALIGCLQTHTHSLLAKADLLVASHLLAIGRTGAGKKCYQWASRQREGDRDVDCSNQCDVMTTVAVTTVGAIWRYPRTQEQHRGAGVAPDPDKWLTMRTVSAGGGHGPIVLGKSEAGGGGVNCVGPETY